MRACMHASEGFTSSYHSLGNTLWALVSACDAVNAVFCLHVTLTSMTRDESEDGILNLFVNINLSLAVGSAIALIEL